MEKVIPVAGFSGNRDFFFPLPGGEIAFPFSEGGRIWILTPAHDVVASGLVKRFYHLFGCSQGVTGTSSEGSGDRIYP